MIEKFSSEELEQILKELGVAKENAKYTVCKDEIQELCLLWKEKGFDEHKKIFTIIDITLNNFKKHRKGMFGCSVKPQDTKEYNEMFQEILEIIKKHNRKWERDTD